jgi:1,4-dihydroxy-2-naphthoyl-CoA synthase
MRARSSDQEDHLLRLIREAAEAIRRCREMLTHSATAAPSVRAALAVAMDRLLGSESSVLQRRARTVRATGDRSVTGSPTRAT